MHFYPNHLFSSSSQKYFPASLTRICVHFMLNIHTVSIYSWMCGLSQAWSTHQKMYSYRKLTPPLPALSIAPFPQEGVELHAHLPFPGRNLVWLESEQVLCSLSWTLKFQVCQCPALEDSISLRSSSISNLKRFPLVPSCEMIPEIWELAI